MTLTGPWIDADETQDVCRMLEAAGHRALLVGGCVRNALMGVAVNDIDISTDARPETVIALVTDASTGGGGGDFTGGVGGGKDGIGGFPAATDGAATGRTQQRHLLELEHDPVLALLPK